jgi:hypothetical protein
MKIIRVIIAKNLEEILGTIISEKKFHYQFSSHENINVSRGTGFIEIILKYHSKR